MNAVPGYQSALGRLRAILAEKTERPSFRGFLRWQQPVFSSQHFTIRAMYDVPAHELGRVLRVGSEDGSAHYWDDLEPWRVNL